MGRVLVSILLVFSVATAPSFAFANMLEVFGTSSRSQGMGGVGVASANDFSALFYNPARLMKVPTSFCVEFQHAYADLGVLLMPRPAGYDPQYYGYLLNPRDDTVELPSMWGVTVGTTFDFGSDIISAGFLVFVPSSGVGNQVSRYANEKEQFFSNRVGFELIGERLQTQNIMSSLALRATEWLQLGIGFSFATASNSSTMVYTPNPANPSTVDMNLSVEQDSRLSLMAGLNVDFAPGFTAGMSLRDEHAYTMSGVNVVQLHGLEGKDSYVMEQPMEFTLHFSPRTFSAGLGYEGEELSLAVDGSYLSWSGYKNAAGEDAGFNDSSDVGAGAELRLGGLKTRVGARYTPSSVPEQTGRSNYADNDRVVVASGVGGTVDVFGNDIGVDLHVQLLMLPSTTHRKEIADNYDSCESDTASLCDEDLDSPGLQTGNPGFPGFTSGGFILAGGVTVSWLFGNEEAEE